MYKKAEASFWTAEELDLAHDHDQRQASALAPPRSVPTTRYVINM